MKGVSVIYPQIVSHAVIRIVSFLILALFLALGNLNVIGIILLITCLLYIVHPPHNISNLLRNIFKMKWLFISIFLVYLLLNDHTNVGLYTSIWDALLPAAVRVLILILMLLLVGWLVTMTPRNDMISALVTLLRPLRVTGFPLEVMALRIELVLNNINAIQSLLVIKRDESTVTRFKAMETGRIMSGIFREVLILAESKPLQTLELRTVSAPTVMQWTLPIFLFAVLFTINYYL